MLESICTYPAECPQETRPSCCTEVLKYRNTTGTLLAPTNNALRNLAAGTGLDVDMPSSINAALVRSVLQYHILFDSVDVSWPIMPIVDHCHTVSPPVPARQLRCIWHVCNR